MPGDRNDMIAGNDDRPYASRDSAPPEGRVGRRPMWLVARTRANERDAVQQALRLTQLEFGSEVGVEGAGGFACGLVLAASSLNGGTGQSVLERSPSGFSGSQRAMLQPLLAQRDQLITLLARADLAVAERLGNAYVSYRQATGTLPGPGGGSR